ncbi:MAG TPA: right-handed parallel beta-helix repeat-containing protein, partial [Fimbriimonas sp.]|nr:right-handed parallel beta-helix repeat-containing protein [Fimbriimonas sp.]
GITLRGSDPSVEPDQRKGLGIKVSGNNITLKNLKVHGYKVGLIAENCKNLKLIDCDFSYNWKQRLASTLEKEDLSDWMSFHKNENDEWLKFGAGVYLKNVTGFEVKNLTVKGGQCALMMTKSSKGLVWNSDLSFNSAIGVGMYRSSDNRIMHNNINFNVRGYSHGVYNRGQDSAGILIYEQSHRNTFAYNSVTHGGDGFFLWAGQTTMDSGKGGCNDNIIYGNDFSFSPTNGIEATFSRNSFVNNMLEECWHGFWTGYSYNTIIAGNHIINNEDGIAHEHGQDNTVEFNEFRGNKTDIRIWANASEDPNWGYPKNRDTASRDWTIQNNNFVTGVADKTLRLSRTTNTKFNENTLFGGSFVIDQATTKNTQFKANCIHTDTKPEEPKGVTDWATTHLEPMPKMMDVAGWSPIDDADVYEKLSPDQLKGGMSPFGKYRDLRGRVNILVDEWGPYDFKSPKLWPKAKDADGWQKYSIYGPKGKWKLASSEGLEVSSTSGTVPGSIRIRAKKGTARQDLKLTYTGKEFVDYKGNRNPANKPYQLKATRFDLPIDWNVTFFAWDKDTQDPRTEARGYDQASALQVVARLKTNKLDFAGYGKFAPNVPANHFGTIAEGEFSIEPGEYYIDVTGDDGVVAVLDENPIVQEWHYQAPTLYSRKVKLGGKHNLVIRHFQIDGYATLRVTIRPAK